jgi:hypothetical protein
LFSPRPRSSLFPQKEDDRTSFLICLRHPQVTASPNPRLFQHINVSCVFQDLATLVIVLALVEWERLRLPTIHWVKLLSTVTIKSQDLIDVFSPSTTFLRDRCRDFECLLEVPGSGLWEDDGNAAHSSFRVKTRKRNGWIEHEDISPVSSPTQPGASQCQRFCFPPRLPTITARSSCTPPSTLPFTADQLNTPMNISPTEYQRASKWKSIEVMGRARAFVWILDRVGPR